MELKTLNTIVRYTNPKVTYCFRVLKSESRMFNLVSTDVYIEDATSQKVKVALRWTENLQFEVVMVSIDHK